MQEAGTAIEAALASNDAKEAWNRLQTWYRQAEDRPPKPSRQDLGKVTDEYANLCTGSTPPGEPIPVMVAPLDIDDSVPGDDEIGDAVRRLRSGKAPGPSGSEDRPVEGLAYSCY